MSLLLQALSVLLAVREPNCRVQVDCRVDQSACDERKSLCMESAEVTLGQMLDELLVDAQGNEVPRKCRANAMLLGH